MSYLYAFVLGTRELDETLIFIYTFGRQSTGFHAVGAQGWALLIIRTHGVFQLVSKSVSILYISFPVRNSITRSN